MALHQYVHIPIVLLSLELGPAVQMGLTREKSPPSTSQSSKGLSNVTQEAVDLPCHRRTLLAHGQLVLVVITQGLSLQWYVPASWPAVCIGAFVLAYPFAELHEILVSSVCHPVISLLTATKPSGLPGIPHSFVSPVNLLRVHSALAPMSLRKMLSSTGISTVHH